jgi:hypothetical protein
MKKVFAMLMVCGLAMAFVACGGAKKEESTPAADTTATEAPAPAPDTTATDTTAAN